MLKSPIPVRNPAMTKTEAKPVAESVNALFSNSPDGLREIVRARLHDAARFRARSTSHTVAARDGCTNIPLAAGRGSGDETILSIGMSGHCYHRFRPPRSARTDQVLGDLIIC